MRRLTLPTILLALTLAPLTLAPAARAQDAAAGQRLYAQCRACHSIEAGGRHGVGPNLHGILGRRAAAAEGFRYSGPMREKAEAGLTWDEAALDAYIENPRAFVPGGSMAFVGLRQAQQRADLIAYLKANGPN